MLAYGLLLRLDINRQVVRKAFNADNASIDMNCFFDQVIVCLRCEPSYLGVNSTSQVPQSSDDTFMSVGEPDYSSANNNTTSEDDETQEFKDVSICHPDPELRGDASRITFLCMGVFSALLLFIKAYIAYRFQNFSSTRMLTLVTLGIAIVLITNAFVVDCLNIPLKSTFLKPGTGNNFKLFVFASSAYFMVHLILKMCCFNVLKENIFFAYHREPEEYMQWFTLLVTLSSTFFTDTLTEPSSISRIASGVVALSAATGATVLVIKIGQSGFTAFGNFATMFHIILRKTPFYFFAFVILLHGFSFGFWILESNLEQRETSTFSDFWKSGILVFMMSFGMTEFDFDGDFKYNTEEGTITVFFTYLLLAFMTLILCLGVLNLLLATIISDHKESANEVTLSHLVFMAKYAIYLDYICQLVKPGFPSFGNWIQGHIDIPQSKREVSYCNLLYCPWDKKKRSRNKSFLCWGSTTASNSKECEHAIAPHFEWVLKALDAIPRAQPDLKSQLKDWLRENRRKEEAAWEELEGILEGSNQRRSVGNRSEEMGHLLHRLDT